MMSDSFCTVLPVITTTLSSSLLLLSVPLVGPLRYLLSRKKIAAREAAASRGIPRARAVEDMPMLGEWHPACLPFYK